VQKAFTRRNLLISAIATVIALSIALYQRRERSIDNLYAQAAGLSGTDVAQAAVRSLSTYRGDRSKRMLLAIASGHTSFPWPSVQQEAIRALSSRPDPEIANSVALLLQPHETLPVRETAAEALKTLPCRGQCVRLILHYLERISQGEMNWEDTSLHAPGMDEVKAGIAKEQRAFYQVLYDVLRRERVATLETLDEVYGIRTILPSTFGLRVLSNTGLSEACPVLLQSQRELKGISEGESHAPREELAATIRTLKCESGLYVDPLLHGFPGR
jgi:hypothetical protein